MPQIVLTNLKKQKLDQSVQAKSLAFLYKLMADDKTLGLHIEPMQKAADPRARTGRVDQFWRALLFKLDQPGDEAIYVYAGTWPHDEAIQLARTRVLRANPINGIAEIIAASMPETVGQGAPPAPTLPVAEPRSFLGALGYLLTDLGDLGFDAVTAMQIYSCASDDELLALSDDFGNEWQVDAVLGLAVGDAVEKILKSLGAGDVLVESVESEDEQLARSLQHPGARMQFAFIENDNELRRIVEGGDFGAWRVFLHPEQRKYTTQHSSGAFRLSGGAGTGKTVVLLHRTRNLSALSPEARIVLTTFTRPLSAALDRDLERLDPLVLRADGLGKPGVLVRGIDALAVAVRDRAGAKFGLAAELVFGAPIEPSGNIVSNDKGWREAIDQVGSALPESLQRVAFFEGEYLQVILPNRIATRDAYFKVHRTGRGVALDRRKRAEIWAVVERYRQTSRELGALSYAEISAIASAYLESQSPEGLADHVLIDEAQDLTPLHWQLLRALVAEGDDDLFIAEDMHQRIYGHHVVLSRCGIRIRGRSRRLKLNYRTTKQNLHYAMGVLAGGDYVDIEGNEESGEGYRSSRSGPSPRQISATTPTGQYDNIAMVVRGWLEDKEIRPETVALLARSNRLVTELRNELFERGVTMAETEPASLLEGRPIVMTMHKAKGMEFSRVLLFDISDGAIPLPWAIQGVAVEEMGDALLRERSLLYVASSRARDELVVSWQGKPSPLLGAVVTT